MALSSLASITG